MGTQLSKISTQHIDDNVEARTKEISALDLGPIKYKLSDPVNGEGWSSEKIEAVAMQYGRFLTLIRENPDQTLVPTEAIDKFWHYHILDTMKYLDDCNKFFGHFVHHFPYLGLRGEDDKRRLAEAFEITLKLYRARFSEELRPIDGVLNQADCSSPGCGGVVCKAGECSTTEQRPEYVPERRLA